MGLKRVGEVASMDASTRWNGPLVRANYFCGDYSLGFGDIEEET
jgi:hypothetical protein